MLFISEYYLSVIYFVVLLVLLFGARFDFFFLAILGIALYFTPFFIKAIYYVDSYGSYDFSHPVKAESVIQLTVIITMVLLKIASHFYYKVLEPKSCVVYEVRPFFLTNFFTLLSFILSFHAIGLGGVSAHKSEFGESMGGLFFFTHYFISMALLFNLYCFFNLRKKLYTVFFVFALLFFSIFLFKTRSFYFFSFIAFFFSFFYKVKLSFFLRGRNFFKIVFLFLLMFFLLSGKHIANMVLYGVEYDSVIQILVDAYEAVGVSSNLNNVVSSDFYYPMFKEVFVSFIPGVSFYDYHTIIKNNFYPNARYGMGRSLFGEIYISFNIFVIVLFPLFFVLMTLLFSMIMERLNGLLRYFFTLLAVFAFFYIHRNGLSVGISYIFYYIYILLFALLFFLILGGKAFARRLN